MINKLICIFIIIVFTSGCELKERKLSPVRTEILRSDYIKDMISNINETETQFLGGVASDSGFSGGGDLFEALRKQSILMFPDGDYFYQVPFGRNKKQYSEYTYWGCYSIDGWMEEIYKKTITKKEKNND